MTSWSKILMASVFMFFLLQVSFLWINASSDDLVSVSLTEAEEALASAYEVVLEAEQAGANVSGLFGRLNLGGEYLAEAFIWYSLGDSESTSRFSGLCYYVATDVRSEAFELRDDVNRLGEADFVLKIIASVVGVIVVVVFCSVAWRVFKRRYLSQGLVLKSEVVSDES